MSDKVQHSDLDSNEFRKAVGQRIRQKRLEMNYCQQGLAESVGVSVSCISCWENGLNCLTLDCLYEVARVLYVHPRELLPECFPEGA